MAGQRHRRTKSAISVATAARAKPTTSAVRNMSLCGPAYSSKSVPQTPIAATRRARAVSPTLLTNRCEIFIEKGFQLVMCRHLVALAALLVQPHPPALAVRIIVVDPHRDHRTYAGEGVGHDADQRAVAQADHRRGVDAL